jgi:tetratricopeptide (TPR) repeat protein
MGKTERKSNSFWNELKRRNVLKTIAMYAGAAFVILEVADIVLPGLGLPDWTITLIILILIGGFPVVVVISWIFDLSPKGFVKTGSHVEDKSKESDISSHKRKLKISDVIIVALFATVLVLLYPKLFTKDKFEDIRDEEGRISIVVMPFQNVSGDSLYAGYELGLQNLLITRLSNSKELSIRPMQTMGEIFGSSRNLNYSSITPAIARDVAVKLNANTVILGYIHKAGGALRMTANFLNSRNGEIYKSFEMSGGSHDDFFGITDSLTAQIQNYLEIRALQQDADQDIRKLAETGSAEAYRYFSKGLTKFYTLDFGTASELFQSALNLDPGFFSAAMFLIPTYEAIGKDQEAKSLTEYYYKNIFHYTYTQQLTIKYWKSRFDKNPLESIRFARLRIEEDSIQRTIWYSLGSEYFQVERYDEAAIAFEKALEIDKRWSGGWVWVLIYVDCGRAYHKLGNFEREKEIYELGLSILPENPHLIFRQAVSALSLGKSSEAKKYLEQYQAIGKRDNWGDYTTSYFTGWIYYEAGLYEKAEEIFRRLIEKDPGEPWVRWHLGSSLIENGNDVNEGLGHIQHALNSGHRDINLLANLYHMKGAALYKLNKPGEALEILKQSWDLRPYYHHQHQILITEVEEALKGL